MRENHTYRDISCTSRHVHICNTRSVISTVMGYPAINHSSDVLQWLVAGYPISPWIHLNNQLSHDWSYLLQQTEMELVFSIRHLHVLPCVILSRTRRHMERMKVSQHVFCELYMTKNNCWKHTYQLQPMLRLDEERYNKNTWNVSYGA